MSRQPRLLDLAALLAGACLPLAFAPFALRILAVLSPLVLFFCWRCGSARRAAWRGMLFGLGMFGCGVYWIYYSLTLFGAAIAPLAALITVGFVSFFAGYLAVLGWLVVRCFARREAARTGWYWALVMPAAWTLGELFRGWFLTGFPWLSLGYSQIDTWLSGYAPLLGVYGVSWMTAATASLVLLAVSARRIAAAALSLVAVIWVGGWVLGEVVWSTPQGEPLRIRIVQGNIAQQQKFAADMLTASIDKYTRLSATDEPVDLIVWPESAIPAFFFRIDQYLAGFARQKRREGTQVLSGGFIHDPNSGKSYNGLRMLDDPQAYYHKQHLVPFGEFLPFRALLESLAQFIQVPMSDLSPGSGEIDRISVNGQRIAASICYEDAFGEELIRQLPAAALLLNISNDSWFGDSAAPYQHLEIARMRAREVARPMVRVTNTGISAIIDHRSRLEKVTQRATTVALNAVVQPRSGETQFVRTGNIPVWSGALGILLGAFLWARHGAAAPQNNAGGRNNAG